MWPAVQHFKQKEKEQEKMKVNSNVRNLFDVSRKCQTAAAVMGGYVP